MYNNYCERSFFDDLVNIFFLQTSFIITYYYYYSINLRPYNKEKYLEDYFSCKCVNIFVLFKRFHLYIYHQRNFHPIIEILNLDKNYFRYIYSSNLLWSFEL